MEEVCGMNEFEYLLTLLEAQTANAETEHDWLAIGHEFWRLYEQYKEWGSRLTGIRIRLRQWLDRQDNDILS
jgi:hypothetical protein